MDRRTPPFIPGIQGCVLLGLSMAFGVFGFLLLPFKTFAILFVGFILVLGIMVKVTAPKITSGYGHRARPARIPRDVAHGGQPNLAAFPGQAAPRSCWQCGGGLRTGAPFCPHCGATQRKAKASSAAATAGMDLPPGTFAPAPPAEMYQPGRPDPLAPPFPSNDA